MDVSFNIEEKIGFAFIKERISAYCHSEIGKERISSTGPSTNLGEITHRLDLTSELTNALSLAPLPVPLCADFVITLKKCEAEGSYFEVEELVDLGEALSSSIDIRNYIESCEGCIALKELAHGVKQKSAILDEIHSILDDKGGIKDSASKDLRRIRKEKANHESGIRKSLKRIHRDAVKAGIVPEGAGPTLRVGRYVIPVIASQKKRLQGFIHDESTSGQTFFIEPAEILELNNSLIELQHAERREIIRILKAITTHVRKGLDYIKATFDFLAHMDDLQARSQFAIEIDGVRPDISTKPGIELKSARHPLLMLSARNAKSVVPLNLQLQGEERILLVSGPNAGGKSVCLKTVGLLQYMIQSGILVPVHPDSRMGVFNGMFIDVGDEQSIESGLSTYSSHLASMRTILKMAGKESLVLIDEFGTGTDPQFGGAIAQAILDKLIDRKCWGVITTHYGNLKEYAQGTSGILNGSMRYDLKSLTPLYQLDIGKPGSSYALEVAGKIGLGKAILEKARKIAGEERIQVEQLLNQLSEKEQKVEVKLKDLEERKKALEVQLQKYRDLFNELNESKQEIIQQAREEARSILQLTNKNIEKTIRHIKENRAQKTETNRVRKQLKDFAENLVEKQLANASEKTEPVVISGPLKVGDYAMVEGSEMVGEVLEIKGNSALLRVGDLQLKKLISDLAKVQTPESDMLIRPAGKFQDLDLVARQRNFTGEIDLRGKRAAEVVSLLENLIDDAMLLGHQKLRILHGKGDGILRKTIRDHFEKYPGVRAISDAEPNDGGTGVSLMALKE